MFVGQRLRTLVTNTRSVALAPSGADSVCARRATVQPEALASQRKRGTRAIPPARGPCELNVGLQKTVYTRPGDPPCLPQGESTENPGLRAPVHVRGPLFCGNHNSNVKDHASRIVEHVETATWQLAIFPRGAAGLPLDANRVGVLFSGCWYQDNLTTQSITQDDRRAHLAPVAARALSSAV